MTKEAKQQTPAESEALRLGWKQRPDGSWSKGRGSNFKRKRTAEDAVAYERAALAKAVQP
jgi:hypothetical protein